MGITPSQRASTLKPHPSVSDVVYFSDADIDDPLVSPIRFTAVLAKFPPTLIVTSTRDLALSPAVHTHTQLVKLGVDAEQRTWLPTSCWSI
jgi:acetyl esterase/lipase